ncbi:His-Xaa-Ser system radical SAM maturase HxsB [Azorhizobium sp. AG788]|uniref:His-Xaa-Ser system radical SAM maturase HxsB n=1 Tax=Azorhizobium sp. AG788 TaxID=2183897 RepID=UPI0010616BFA|nr:His-Xaa-Ser system radical SAM maturase HxsB [Azorhizobium sp. AG788]TDT92506.1 His-Xaa-Ser system radical SAM maturase HxsB [Azorhizobium sp. AG788]
MKVWPLRFRHAGDDAFIFSDDAGGFFRGSEAFLRRYAEAGLDDHDRAFLLEGGHAYRRELDLPYTAFAYRWAARQAVRRTISYVVLVPTLRCDLTCSYCQVSRAALNAQGFDWTEETARYVEDFLGGLDTEDVKVEFQGGEPLLRLDLLERIRSFCRSRFRRAEFVVCTNLQNVDEAAWRFLEAPDTFVSTSLDGDEATHRRQRTKTAPGTEAFFQNLDEAVRRLGPGKVSALPTIDIDAPPDVEAMIDNFERRGIRSIYLRPVNHQGFARRGREPDAALDRWIAWHAAFVERLIERNHRTGSSLEEYYFSQCLRRVLRFGADGHVDLRNPSFFASDYIVIDHDGTFYPTDEARMQSRIGRIDLSVGNVRDGLGRAKIDTLNSCSLNNFDPDCIHCAFQPFCGSDVIDDISRYGTIDIPRTETWFCRRHTALFDKVFELLYRDDEATRRSLALWLGIPEWTDNLVRVHQ